MCIWDSYFYQKAVLCFIIDKCYIRSVKKGIVLSVSMLRFQYSLKLSLSSTLVGMFIIIIIIIIIIINSEKFGWFSTVRASLTKHFLFNVFLKTF